MFFLAFFIMILFLLIIFCSLWLSLKLLASVDGKGFHMDVRVMLYRFLTLYKWDFEEGGASFLAKKKKQVPDEMKKKKGWLAGTFEVLLSKDTFDHLRKNIRVFDVSVKGRVATKDAAATALIFGSIWGVLGALIPFIPQKHLSLDFYPDFQKDTPDFHISCILRVRIIHIIMLIAENKRKKLRKGRSESYGTASY